MGGTWPYVQIKHNRTLPMDMSADAGFQAPVCGNTRHTDVLPERTREGFSCG